MAHTDTTRDKDTNGSVEPVSFAANQSQRSAAYGWQTLHNNNLSNGAHWPIGDRFNRIDTNIKIKDTEVTFFDNNGILCAYVPEAGVNWIDTVTPEMGAAGDELFMAGAPTIH
jgi:hypothetical protein